ncbi:bestrophin-like domain, partial [Singulisphaera rosea]
MNHGIVMLDILRDCPTGLIVFVFLGLMVLSNELGFRVGRRHSKDETEVSRNAGNAFKGSIFGLVALVLGFSFSATMSRYDLRQRIVLDQSNAIGTCHQRAGLLDEVSRDRIRGLLRAYLGSRLEQYRKGHDSAAFDLAQVEVDRHLAALWEEVEEANRREPDMVRNSLIVPAANEVIDLSSTRTWANRNHLPEPVLFLLMASVLVACLLLGHSSGQSGLRHASLWLASNVIFALVLYVV